MEIFKSLGVNSTLWIHLGCFLISYLAISQLIFKPYMAALKAREERTVGGEETATRLIEEANSLHAEYERRAKSINGEIKDVYDQSRVTAMKEYERLLAAAREEAAKVMEQTRAQIGQEVQGARQKLSAEVPAVSATIATKLSGKEISL